MNGYTKVLIKDHSFVEAGETITGKLYDISFYLPGDIVDYDQRYFVKDGDDVDTIASHAYYEKQLAYIKTIKQKEGTDLEIQDPKPFSEYSTLKEFKAESAENKGMLRDGNIPIISMPMGKDLEKKA